MAKFNCNAPCAKCPFRNDITPYLRASRVREIITSTVYGEATFQCHETVTHDDDGEAIRNGKELICAGSLIMAESIGRVPQLVRIAERFGEYDHKKLRNKELVYATPEKMIAAHRKACG